MAQASILELYDPDRSRGVIRRQRNDKDRKALPTGWDDFARWAKGVFKGDGRGICVLSEVSNSPSLAEMRARFKKAFPKAEWFRYTPLANSPAFAAQSLSQTATAGTMTWHIACRISRKPR